MLDKVLTVVKPEKNKDYIDRFNELIQTSSVTYKRVKELLEKKLILGILNQSTYGYENVLSFERLEKLEEHEVSPSHLVTNHLAGRYGLDIGSKVNNLEILQFQHPECYSMHTLPLSLEIKKWIEIPKEFLRETHDILPSTYMKRKFECLKK